MSVISIVNQKGGTGKTTTTLNLGSALAQLGRKVLMIDMDAQGNLGYSYGLDADKSIVDILEGNSNLSEVVQEVEGVEIIPSDIRLVDLELSLVEMNDRHSQLAQAITDFSKDFDYVLIDCPPSLSILALNALYASDFVIIPMLMEVLSLQGLDQIIQTIKRVNKGFEKELKVLGILPVMVDKRRKLTDEVKDYIAENYELRIFNSMIRNKVKASESPSFGQSVIAYAPSSNSAKDYKQFANEIISLI